MFAGATSFYGVSDLAKLYEFTHKFESKYPEKLVGGTPLEIPDVYKARSPVYHADDIVTALLVSSNKFATVLIIFNLKKRSCKEKLIGLYPKSKPKRSIETSKDVEEWLSINSIPEKDTVFVRRKTCAMRANGSWLFMKES